MWTRFEQSNSNRASGDRPIARIAFAKRSVAARRRRSTHIRTARSNRLLFTEQLSAPLRCLINCTLDETRGTIRGQLERAARIPPVNERRPRRSLFSSLFSSPVSSFYPLADCRVARRYVAHWLAMALIREAHVSRDR